MPAWFGGRKGSRQIWGWIGKSVDSAPEPTKHVGSCPQRRLARGSGSVDARRRYWLTTTAWYSRTSTGTVTGASSATSVAPSTTTVPGPLRLMEYWMVQ